MYSSSKVNGDFKSRISFEDRKDESTRILKKYDDRIPIICEKSNTNDSMPTIDKIKYLVPADLSIGQFMYVIRKRLTLKPEQAIFLFIDNTLPPASELISSIYTKYKDEDGFLYVKYSGENTFG